MWFEMNAIISDAIKMHSHGPPNRWFSNESLYHNPTRGQHKIGHSLYVQKRCHPHRVRASYFKNKLFLSITVQRRWYKMNTSIIEDVINVHLVAPWSIIFAWIIVEKYQASTWGHKISLRLKKIDSTHKPQRVYLKTHFNHYYHSFLWNPLILIPCTIKEEAFHVFIFIWRKSGASFINTQRCGPMCPMGYKIPQGDHVSRRGTSDRLGQGA